MHLPITGGIHQPLLVSLSLLVFWKSKCIPLPDLWSHCISSVLVCVLSVSDNVCVSMDNGSRGIHRSWLSVGDYSSFSFSSMTCRSFLGESLLSSWSKRTVTVGPSSMVTLENRKNTSPKIMTETCQVSVLRSFSERQVGCSPVLFSNMIYLINHKSDTVRSGGRICTCYLSDYLVRLGFRTVCMSKRTSTLGDESESHAVCATSNHTYNACVYDVAVGFPITQFVCTVDSGHLNYYARRTVGTHCNRQYAGALPRLLIKANAGSPNLLGLLQNIERKVAARLITKETIHADASNIGA